MWPPLRRGSSRPPLPATPGTSTSSNRCQIAVSKHPLAVGRGDDDATPLVASSIWRTALTTRLSSPCSDVSSRSLPRASNSLQRATRGHESAKSETPRRFAPRRIANGQKREALWRSLGTLAASRWRAGVGNAAAWLDLLRKAGVTAQDEDGVDRPTVAGLLAFSSDPARHLRSDCIDAACYGGTRPSLTVWTQYRSYGRP